MFHRSPPMRPLAWRHMFVGRDVVVTVTGVGDSRIEAVAGPVKSIKTCSRNVSSLSANFTLFSSKLLDRLAG